MCEVLVTTTKYANCGKTPKHFVKSRIDNPCNEGHARPWPERELALNTNRVANCPNCTATTNGSS